LHACYQIFNHKKVCHNSILAKWSAACFISCQLSAEAKRGELTQHDKEIIIQAPFVKIIALNKQNFTRHKFRLITFTRSSITGVTNSARIQQGT